MAKLETTRLSVRAATGAKARTALVIVAGPGHPGWWRPPGLPRTRMRLPTRTGAPAAGGRPGADGIGRRGANGSLWGTAALGLLHRAQAHVPTPPPLPQLSRGGAAALRVYAGARSSAQGVRRQTRRAGGDWRRRRRRLRHRLRTQRQRETAAAGRIGELGRRRRRRLRLRR
jgi:hypothetical protein